MRDVNAIPDILTQADIFCDLRSDELALIASISVIRECRANEVIFEEKSASNELYVIVDGEVDIKVDPARIGEAASNQPVTLVTLRRGQSFGEIALVDMGLRSATACSALHETRLIVIPREALMRLCHEHPQLGYVLMRNLAIDLASKIRAADIQLSEWLTWGKS